RRRARRARRGHGHRRCRRACRRDRRERRFRAASRTSPRDWSRHITIGADRVYRAFAMTTPAIITVAITGSLPRKENNPAVPITIAEQVESTQAAFEAGAT